MGCHSEMLSWKEGNYMNMKQRGKKVFHHIESCKSRQKEINPFEVTTIHI